VKKAIISGLRKAELVDAPDPQPKEDWALVKVHATPMCTEYKAFLAGHRSEFLGHEAAGEVAAVAQPGHVRVGDRVVVMPCYPCGRCPLCVAGDYIHCQHARDLVKFTGSREGGATYAQFLLKPSWLLPKIPDGLSCEMASLAVCALGPSFGAFERMNLSPFDTVLITGAGPVGLGAVANAQFRRARILVAESVPYRMQKALELGAEAAIDPAAPDARQRILDLTKGVGVDKALDCSGVVAAHRLCIDAVRRRGHVAFVGECNDDTPIKVSPDLIRKGITIHGVWHYNLSGFPRIMKVIQQSAVVDRLISHVLPMSQIQQAFEVSASRECAKIILNPWK
jgi:threonine dehydrogenase-like Zn-dependent dehydrogenase